MPPDSPLQGAAAGHGAAARGPSSSSIQESSAGSKEDAAANQQPEGPVSWPDKRRQPRPLPNGSLHIKLQQDHIQGMPLHTTEQLFPPASTTFPVDVTMNLHLSGQLVKSGQQGILSRHTSSRRPGSRHYNMRGMYFGYYQHMQEQQYSVPQGQTLFIERPEL